MRKLLLILAPIMFVFTLNAFAEEDIQPQEFLTDVKYFKHMTGWYEVPSEKIYVENQEIRFHLDSDNMIQNINAQVMPANATDRTLEYYSSNENIVSVDGNGNLTSYNHSGKVTITIISGQKRVEIPVDVIRGVSGINLSEQDITFYVDRPAAHKINAVISPSDATDKRVKWSSSDTAVAAVDGNGNITPVGVGNAQITAVTVDGGFKSECIARVTIYDVPVRAVFIENAIEALRINGDYQLTSYVYPQNARNKAVSWSSSNADVVTVDSEGNLRGISEGNAMITVRTQNGAEDTFTINIVPDDGTPFEFKLISRPVSERIAELSMPVVYSHVKNSLETVINTQMSKSPTVFTTNASPASREDVEKYINPENFLSGSDKYQFVILSGSNGISETTLNAYLSNKGVLAGKGREIINAAKNNNISEIYLAVHAALESGNGSSKLACGIEYNGTVVYNMFGIGAYDRDPVNEGAKYAYEHNWTSIDAAIEGGARWISENYINASTQQNTLYNMRWNPNNPGVHQYATDVAWAVKQAKTICAMFGALPQANIKFDIPVYNGQNEAAVPYE